LAAREDVIDDVAAVHGRLPKCRLSLRERALFRAERKATLSMIEAKLHRRH
jgi:hypothetical protein